jgi:UDPglucose--hexose-1-phosphate uridylyltransferase
MKIHWEKNQSSLIEKIIEGELKDKERIIVETNTIVCFVPVFARYPYETWIVPKRRVGLLHDLTPEEVRDLSLVLKTLLLKYDHLWNKKFPYLMTIHQAPAKGMHPYAHLFFQITPPYRTKEKLKYLAGTELGAGVFINDSLPEEKARELKAVEVKI